MFLLETNKELYIKIKEAMFQLYPEIKISLISCDDVLEKMGFCDSAPCVLGFDLTKNEMDALLDDLMQIETEAFNTPDGKYPSCNDPDYQRYEKYGWLYDELSRVKKNRQSDHSVCSFLYRKQVGSWELMMPMACR